MKLFFYIQNDEQFPWMGAVTSIKIIQEGLKNLGIEAYFSSQIEEAYNYDFAFISAITIDLNPIADTLRFFNKRYGVIPFQEDYLNFSGPAHSFFGYVGNALKNPDCDAMLEALFEQPEIVRYLPFPPRKSALVNYEVLKNARLCIANSHTEELTIKRDCPRAVTEVVYWTPGFLFETSYPYSNSFLPLVGLKPNEYILQIGRIEPRKNQLATILATRHLDIPLVFIANSIFQGYMDYAMTCIEAIKKYRKAPTIIVTGSLPPTEEGPLKIISTKQQDGLSQNLLVSAYQNAGLYVHPAFYELPGYVHLEAAKLGTPCVATEWSTLKDYFTDGAGNYMLDDRIVYANPYDINALEKKILLQFGKRYDPGTLPIFFRTPNDVAKDFKTALDRHYINSRK